MRTLTRMRCSFCRRHHTEVQKLVAGPRTLLTSVYICDRCATQAVAIMESAPAPDPGGQARQR